MHVTQQRVRTLLKELITVGVDPNLWPFRTFTPLEELTPSPLPTELSDLTPSLRSSEEELSSGEEVERIISAAPTTSTTLQTTRSQARVQQAQVPSVIPNAMSGPSQPTNPMPSQNSITQNQTAASTSVPTALIQVPNLTVNVLPPPATAQPVLAPMLIVTMPAPVNPI